MSAAVFTPVAGSAVVPLLALAGLGLGTFVPVNNTVIMRGTADSSASLLGALVNLARGIGMTLGISLMALALYLGDPGNFPNASHGYAESAQARPAFIVLAVVSAAAAAIALAGRAQPRGESASQGGGAVRCLKDTERSTS